MVQGSTFEYVSDPLAKLDLSEWLGPDPKPLGMAINGWASRLYLYHARFFGSIDVFDISSGVPEYDPTWSVSGLFTEAIETTEIPGLRKVLGGDIVIDHVDGEEGAQCRTLLYANTMGGGSWLRKLDVWNQTLAVVPLGSPWSCMTISNLPTSTDRGVVLFPMGGGAEYVLFSAPVDW